MSETVEQLTQEEQEYFTSRGESGWPQEGGTAPEENSEGPADQHSHMDAATRPNRTVPHAALHAEREEHKKTRSELQQLRAQAQQMQQELQAVMAKAHHQDSRAGPQAPPDPREDFLGFTRWQVDEINRLKQEIAENRLREEETRQAEQAEQALWNEWSQCVERARTEYKDLDEALNFVARARDRQLTILAQADPRFHERSFRESQMPAELRDIVVAAFQEGKDPAKTVYEMARAYGYGSELGARFARLNDAQAASRTLTASTGKEAGDPMLLETVAALSEEDFAKWYENNRQVFRKMFGG